MKIVSFSTNFGPNVFHPNPTIVMTLDLGEFKDTASSRKFCEKLLAAFPGLRSHTCSRGYEGGFIERLKAGTYPAHIIEHLALELSSLCGIEVSFGKTRYAGRPGFYEICTTFKNEEGMKECFRQAVDAVECLLTGKEIIPDLQRIKDISADTALGPSGQALFDAAVRREIPVRRIGSSSLLQLGYGQFRNFVETAVTSRTGLIASEIVQDKNLTKSILQLYFIQTPKGVAVSTEEELHEFCVGFRGPYAVKPVDGNHGRGVFLNLKTYEEVLSAFYNAKKISDCVIVEEMCLGRDYRILLVNYKISAVAERIPVHVKGDGEKNLQQLIDEVNSDPRRQEGHRGLLTKIVVDDMMRSHLLKNGIKSLDYVAPAGKVIELKANANISTGGTAIDVTEKIHPELKILCERAARAVGLDICGLDLIHPDIEWPPGEETKIIEINAGPGLRMHLAPSEGKSRDVADDIIRMLYPDGNARIPIISVTGTNGKTTTVRLLHRILMDQRGPNIGLTTTDGIWLGKNKIYTGDTTGPKSAQVLLSDPAVSIAVLEVARGGLLRGGLAYDWSDISVITNIQADHLGQNGIEDIDDIVWIKSLVAERVKKGGTLVLNADDHRVLALKDNPRVQRHNPDIFLFSAEPDNIEFKKHLYSGGNGCWIERGRMLIQHKDRREVLAMAKDFPLTLKGMAAFQNLNILAAFAAATAAGVDRSLLLKSLLQFNPGEENPGRMTIFRVGEAYVVLDYGHNPDALISVGKMLERMPGYRKTAVVGLPGDRNNELLEKSADAMADYFDKFILKDDVDLRGRSPAEVPNLLYARLEKLGLGKQAEIIPNEVEAFETALHEAESPEIIFVIHDRFADLMSVLLKYSPKPVDFIPQLKEGSLTDDHSMETETIRHVYPT